MKSGRVHIAERETEQSNGFEPPVEVFCDPDSDGVIDVLVEPVHVGGSDPKNGWRIQSDTDRVTSCEHFLGYTFADKSLLKNALTHSSSTSDKSMDNERLEFFGDAVLDLVVREDLFHNYPNRQEGDLTEAKSAVVCRSSLVRAARKLRLRECLQLGRGIGKKKAVPDSLLADAFEAVVAAIYLDGGYRAARKFIMANLGDAIPKAVAGANAKNYKSTLQKVLQQRKRPLPVYRVVDTSGPEHSRMFQVAVVVEDEELGRGTGSNKKSAEQEAAKAALSNVEVEDNG